MRKSIRNICKKILVCILAAAISSSGFCEIPITVYAGDGSEIMDDTTDQPDSTGERTYTDGQGIIYTLLSNNSCYVSGCSENINSSVKIPEEIRKDDENYHVKGIRAGAFEKCTVLKTAEVSNSITDIEGDVFKNCSNLEEISVVLDKTAIKTSGRTSIVTVKIDDGLLCTPAGVKLEIGTAVIDQAASDKKTNQVTLKVLVVPNDNYSGEDVTPDSIVLQKKAVKALTDGRKGFKLQVRDVEGSSYYVMLKASYLKKVTGNLRLAVCKKEINAASGKVKTDLKKALSKNSIKAKNTRIFTYNFGKGSRTMAKLTIPATAVKGAKSGSKVYVYRYDTDRRVFAAISLQPYIVTEKGNISLTVFKGGTFIVTKKAFRVMSRKPASEFIADGSATYYVNKNSSLVRGWKKLGGEYYYFDRKNGKMAAGKTVDGVKLTANGTAKRTKAGVAKIKTMIKARAVVEKVTKPTDSLEQKRLKCFRWVFQFPYRRYRNLRSMYKKPV